MWSIKRIRQFLLKKFLNQVATRLIFNTVCISISGGWGGGEMSSSSTIMERTMQGQRGRGKIKIEIKILSDIKEGESYQ